MNLTKRAVEQLSYAKQGGAADYRWDDKLKGFGVRVYPSGRRTFLITYRNAQGTKRFLSLGDWGSRVQIPALRPIKSMLYRLTCSLRRLPKGSREHMESRSSV